MPREFLLIISSLLVISSCSPKIMPEITRDDLRVNLSYLASDDLKGRYPGTPEDSALAAYISERFRQSGLIPLQDGYSFNFDLLSGIIPDSGNYIVFGSMAFEQGKDFYPLSFSGSGEISEGIVFGGYGFDFETSDYRRHDYEFTDPQGKWVLILRGEPENHPSLVERSRDRDKALLAADKGAAGVLFLSGEEFSSADDLPGILTHEPEISIPVLVLTRKAVERILQEKNLRVADLEKMARAGGEEILMPEGNLSAIIRIEKKYSTTRNVLGYFEGLDPSLNEWIVIGAHHDHLGMGGPGSSSRMPDTVAVHNGADDNASGVAAIIELSEYFSAKENRTRRNLLFITFGAEEKGLLGSRHFTEDPPIELSTISAMVNLDMMGRMNEDSILQIGGIGTSLEGREMVREVNKAFNLNLSLSDAGYGPSDHASFYTKDIPVFFLSTGAHSDYHTPMDDESLINYPGLVKGVEFTAALIKKIDMEDKKLAFQEAGPKSSTSRSYRNRITLGIMPDVSGEGKNGMAVLAVTPGKPADLGGMKKGDIITSIEGKSVSNVYDYMYRLNELKTGDRIVVTVKRNNSLIDLLIQL